MRRMKGRRLGRQGAGTRMQEEEERRLYGRVHRMSDRCQPASCAPRVSPGPTPVPQPVQLLSLRPRNTQATVVEQHWSRTQRQSSCVHGRTFKAV